MPERFGAVADCVFFFIGKLCQCLGGILDDKQRVIPKAVFAPVAKADIAVQPAVKSKVLAGRQGQASYRMERGFALVQQQPVQFGQSLAVVFVGIGMFPGIARGMDTGAAVQGGHF